MQKHSYDHANRSRRQEHHGHLPRHYLNKTWAETTGFRWPVMLSTCKELAEMCESIAVGGESMQAHGLVGSGQDAE
jgi:hypothetical protein